MPRSCSSASSPAIARTSPGIRLSGRPARLLDRCIDEAGIERGRAYVTNAVKHFKWVPRGTRRIHSKPNSMEIAACFPWLEAEIAAVRPKIVVALGATAAQALFGKAFRVTRDRGRLGAVALGALRAGDGASVIAAARPRRGDPPSRDRPVHRGSEKGRGADARMTTAAADLAGAADSRSAGSRSVLIAVMVAAIALLASAFMRSWPCPGSARWR